MATKLLHKRGTSNPTASDLSVGEIGINTTDGGIFTKTSGGAIVEAGGSGGQTYTAGTGLSLSSNTFSLDYGGASSNAVRKITTSTSAPSGGSDGDIWIKYTN